MSFSIHTTGEGSRLTIRLTDTQTGTVAEIFAFGGFLNALIVQTPQGPLNVIDGFTDPDDAIAHITDGFKSAKMSPFACRLKDGRYRFDDTEYTLDSFYLGDHALHGFLYDAVYTIKHTAADKTAANVELEHTYKGHFKGYPFNYTLNVKWELRSGNDLTVTTTAINHSEKAIPFSDGWHPYFTAGVPVDECELKFNTHKRLVFDAELIPTDKEEVDDRFISGQSLQNIFLDNSFILPITEQGYCELKSKQVRIVIKPLINYPYLQVYTPEHRKSVAIENLSAAPDAFNNGMGLIYLLPNEPVSFATSYRVDVL
jgi:aldose 1-epimerase